MSRRNQIVESIGVTCFHVLAVMVAFGHATCWCMRLSKSCFYRGVGDHSLVLRVSSWRRPVVGTGGGNPRIG
ncbi:hypothetical protein F2Q70_00011222 [Brassica cretica]|uniref:Uncharacterized protein n=1 Tax=Brassica cretica TaxID=69181 RepID=A0A8S9JC08_BRACR|nr:hypothetical protein F2Q68_00004354 [Brassica cretica]KAF2612195.1 hypothetical protein F2Q70_00011222 [Brassica cretica]